MLRIHQRREEKEQCTGVCDWNFYFKPAWVIQMIYKISLKKKKHIKFCMCEAICTTLPHSLVCVFVCALVTVSDAPKCMCNLRFRWWCRRVCKYVSGICYHGNRHSVSRCNGMAGAVLLARSSFHSDSTSQLPMQEFVCVCVCVSLYEYGVNPLWIWVFISVPRYVWLAL